MKELLDRTNSKITILLRGENISYAKKRFNELWKYYFNQPYVETRINMVIGDISLDNLGLNKDAYEKCERCEAIINCAANVRFFQEYIETYDTNVKGAMNIIKFAEEKNTPIYHISTESVVGSTDGSNIIQKYFDENVLYIGQEYEDNAYIRTKFEAERALIDAAEKGIPVTIYRIGNLTGRYTDGIPKEYKRELFL